MSLPDWLPHDEINTLFQAIASKGESRLVGGCVRNAIKGSRDTDIDIATQVSPEEVMELLTKKNIKCIPTGLKHGTVTAVINTKHYEITTLRKDIETSGRHATVEFTDDWKLDAERRDFTINAMYMDLDSKIYDYFGGQADLEQNLIRFVGEPEQRIKEDFLRILRYFRFYSYMNGKNIHQPSLDACKKLATGISQLSGERIMAEMLKILISPYAIEAIELMHSNLILEVLGLEISNEKLWECSFNEDPIINLAAVIRCCSNPENTAAYVIARWRFPNRLAELLEFLVALPFERAEKDINRIKLAYRFGIEKYISGLKLLACEKAKEDFSNEFDFATKMFIPKFPISGGEILEIGYKGASISRELRNLENLWIESDFKISKTQLIDIAKKELEQW